MAAGWAKWWRGCNPTAAAPAARRGGGDRTRGRHGGRSGRRAGFVGGLATFAWDAGDETARRLAGCSWSGCGPLVSAGGGGVRGKSGHHLAGDQALSEGGLAGLVPARHGPEAAVEAGAAGGGADRRTRSRRVAACSRSPG